MAVAVGLLIAMSRDVCFDLNPRRNNIHVEIYFYFILFSCSPTSGLFKSDAIHLSLDYITILSPRCCRQAIYNAIVVELYLH